MTTTLVLLLFAHALADYPLQGDFLARAKSRRSPIESVDWWVAMAAHCAIHAGSVLLITGSLACAAFEFVAHFFIDHFKCEGVLSFRMDQMLHVGCKLVIVASVALREATP